MRSNEHREEVKNYIDNKIEMKRTIEQNLKNTETKLRR